MLSKRWDEITITDLENLVETRQTENQRLEFKREVKFTDKESKREFLRDVTSLANTRGGYIVIGVEEENGEAIALPGIELADPDKYKLQLDQVIRDTFEPKLPGIMLLEFKLKNSQYVIVVYVPRSSMPPHRAQGDQFFMRASNGKYPVSVDQLRQIFTQGVTLLENMRHFVRERISLVAERVDGPIAFDATKTVVMVHLIPFASLESSVSLPISIQLQRSLGQYFQPFGPDWGYKPGFNADGLISYYQDSEAKQASYTQLFRNGILEGASSAFVQSFNNVHTLSVSSFEKHIVSWLERSLWILQVLEIEPPFEVMISLQNVRSIKLPTEWVHSYSRPIGRDLLRLPEITLESIQGLVFGQPNNSEAQQAIAQRMKPLFDALCQAADIPFSQSFQSDGTWKPS